MTSCKKERGYGERTDPKGNPGGHRVLIQVHESQCPFRATRRQFKRASFVPRDPEICVRFRMARVEREGAFVIQNGATKIPVAEMSVAQIVEQIRAPRPGANELFVMVDCFFELPGGKFLIRFCKLRVGLRERR